VRWGWACSPSPIDKWDAGRGGRGGAIGAQSEHAKGSRHDAWAFSDGTSFPQKLPPNAEEAK